MLGHQLARAAIAGDEDAQWAVFGQYAPAALAEVNAARAAQMATGRREGAYANLDLANPTDYGHALMGRTQRFEGWRNPSSPYYRRADAYTDQNNPYGPPVGGQQAHKSPCRN
jgi:hypothetical protein